MEKLSGLIYCPDFRFHPGTIYIEDGLIREISLSDEQSNSRNGCTDETGRSADCGDTREEEGEVQREDQREENCGMDYIIPGLIDIHFHGCMGMDFCDGTREALETLAAWEVSQGITSICPATLTLPAEELKHILSLAAEFAAEQEEKEQRKTTECENTECENTERRLTETGNTVQGNSQQTCAPIYADLVGINMEGPFISHVKKGAQNGKYIVPCDAQICRSFLKASEGLVKIIGLAPEENPGFEDYIRAVKDEVRVSLAHTNADYETAKAAFEAGASHAVHLYNAMTGMSHREPGVVGAVADCKEITAELICDGNHVHPAVVRATFAMLGDERIVLISDSLRAAGMGDGEIMLGGQKVIVQGTRATLAEGGNLAGSVSSLMGCLQTVVKEMGIPLESAVRCATYNPAKVIGEQDRCGSLKAGRKADIVVLGPDLQVKQVYKSGRRTKE